jgi:hypothetical protein
MRFRLSILGLMGMIAIIGVGMAAIRNNDEIWAAVILGLTISALCTSTLVAIYRRGAWAGFAVFGWAIFLLCQPNSARFEGQVPQTTAVAGWLLQFTILPTPSTTRAFFEQDVIHSVRSLLCLLSLIVGLLGAIVGGFIARRCVVRRDDQR